MWLGIPYTNYGSNVTLPVIPRMFIFCAISGLLYYIISSNQVLRIVGNLSGFNTYDDKETYDIYYLQVIHGTVYSILMYMLLKFYNPYLVPKKNIVL